MLDENSSELDLANEISRLSKIIQKKRRERQLANGCIRYNVKYVLDEHDGEIKTSPYIQEYNLEIDPHASWAYTSREDAIQNEIDNIKGEIESAQLQIAALEELRANL